MANRTPVGGIDDDAMTNTLICKSNLLDDVAIATKPEGHLVFIMTGGKVIKNGL